MSEYKRTLETLELVGGALCLDFVNTVNSRHNPEHEYLSDYSELVKWGEKLRVLTSEQGSRLQRQASREPQTAEKTLKKALELRELLYRLFSGLADKSKPDKEDLARLVQFQSEAISAGELVKVDDHFIPRWDLAGSYDAVLWPITYSAAQILQSKDASQVKECPSCGWLFLDTSKNQSRRWCSMNTCGVRDKMKRYHRKLRSKS